MTPLLNVLLTAVVIAGGSFAIVYALRFFPVSRRSSDQLEMDLSIAPDYIRKSRAMAHDARSEADAIRGEVARLKAKPRIKR
jgi:hypothetical protein